MSEEDKINELNDIIVQTLKGLSRYKKDAVARKTMDALITILTNNEDKLAGMTASFAIGFYTAGLTAQVERGQAEKDFWELRDKIADVMKDYMAFGKLPNANADDDWDKL